MDPLVERMVVHDLKNPLSAIVGSAELFFEGLLGKLTDEQLKHIGAIRLSSKMLSNILSDLQDIRNMEDKEFSLGAAIIPVKDVISELSWLTDYARLEEKKIEIKPGEVENIFADKSVILRVMGDIALNSIKQANRGSTVTINFGKEKEFIKIEIINDGDGMPKDVVSNIFDESFKIKNPKLKTMAGAGLGFYFCKLAMREHKGKIEAVSDIGHGLKITLYLPIGGRT